MAHKKDGYHCVIDDEQGDWYVIPRPRMRDFLAWSVSGSNVVPAWAVRVVGSPSRVLFTEWEID